MTINGEENGKNNYFEKKTPCILTFNMKNKYIHFILYFFLPAFGSMLQFNRFLIKLCGICYVTLKISKLHLECKAFRVLSSPGKRK